MWPVLITCAVLAAIVLCVWRRAKLLRAHEETLRELESLKREHALVSQEQQAQQAAIFNSMAEALLLLDEQRRVKLANRAFLALFDISRDVTGKSVLEVLRFHEIAELIDRLSPELNWATEELKVSSPTELWLRVSAAVIRNPTGRREGTLLVFHNLTRLKQLERAREEFVANVSHELRTPLSHIKGYVETLLDGAKSDPEVLTRFLETIARNAERLRLLIEDLLTISELESGRVKLNLQQLELRPLVEKIFDDFRAHAAQKEVALSNQISGLSVRADAIRLEQVIFNLVDNAIKYGRHGGEVVVSATESSEGRVEVSVQDDGPGLPPEACERVFERFYRVDKGRSREQGGTGLGLSIVKHIVQNHGGKVWAKSEPNRATTFFFTLPRG